MLTVDDYGQIHRAHRDGMSPDVHREAIARRCHHSRRKVREALACPEPKPYTRTKDPPAPKLGPFTPIIEEILKADEQAPRKQRHTAAQIFRRLQSEQGYAGGYDQVCRYVQKHRRSQRVTFIPLSHDPGQRPECDYGHIAVDFPDGRRQVPVFIAAWAYSKRVRFFTAANVVTRLEEAQKHYQLDRFLAHLDKADLLICDELGYLSFSRTGAELLSRCLPIVMSGPAC